MKASSDSRKWLDYLDDEDLGFLKRFLLASGSLKKVAKIYGVSYPTVRLRIDRLIQKVKIRDEAEGDDSYEVTLRSLAAEGRFDTATLKTLLRSYRQAKQVEENGEPDAGTAQANGQIKNPATA